MELLHHNADKFFSRGARFTIVIPLIVLLLGLGIKAYQFVRPAPTSLASFNISTPTPASQEVLDSLSQMKDASSGARIDLVGPYVCNYTSDDATAAAVIKNRQVFIENRKPEETDYFLLKDDCFYLWEKNSFAGDKICGLKPYLSLFDMFSQFNFLSRLNSSSSFDVVKTLSSSVSSQSGASLKQLDIQKALRSCVKKEFTPGNRFTVPANVLFKNISIEGIMRQ